MKLSMSILAGAAAACMMLCGSVAQAQPVISGVFPNGAYQFQSSATLSLAVTSTVGISNVTVTLNLL